MKPINNFRGSCSNSFCIQLVFQDAYLLFANLAAQQKDREYKKMDYGPLSHENNLLTTD